MVQVNFPKDFQNGNVTIENSPTSDKKRYFLGTEIHSKAGGFF